MAMYKMKGRTPTEDPETHGAILQQWRKSLVGAMKQVRSTRSPVRRTPVFAPH